MFEDKINSAAESAKNKIEDAAHSDGDVTEMQMIAEEMLANMQAINDEDGRELDGYAATAIDRLENVPQHPTASYSSVKSPLFEAADEIKKSHAVEFDEVRASKSFDLF